MIKYTPKLKNWANYENKEEYAYSLRVVTLEILSIEAFRCKDADLIESSLSKEAVRPDDICGVPMMVSPVSLVFI